MHTIFSQDLFRWLLSDEQVNSRDELVFCLRCLDDICNLQSSSNYLSVEQATKFCDIVAQVVSTCVMPTPPSLSPWAFLSCFAAVYQTISSGSTTYDKVSTRWPHESVSAFNTINECLQNTDWTNLSKLLLRWEVGVDDKLDSLVTHFVYHISLIDPLREPRVYAKVNECLGFGASVVTGAYSAATMKLFSVCKLYPEIEQTDEQYAVMRMFFAHHFLPGHECG